MNHHERKLEKARVQLKLFESAENANPIYVKILRDRVAVLEREVVERAPKPPKREAAVTAVPEAPPKDYPTCHKCGSILETVQTRCASGGICGPASEPTKENAPPTDADDAPPLERPAAADLLDYPISSMSARVGDLK